LRPRGTANEQRRRAPSRVSAEETIALAAEHALGCVLNVHEESKLAANRADGVTWSRLAFRPIA
jgi:hypothetical protein